MDKQRRTQKQRVEESARRLADAAVALIAEKGYAATTAQEIGLRAGYSRDMVRVRYGTKEALVDSILSTLYESRLRGIDEPDASGLDRVLAVARLLHTFAVEDPVLLRAMFTLNFEAAQADDLLRQRVNRWLDESLAQIRSAVEAGKRDATVAADVDPIGQSREMLATVIGFAYLWTVDPENFDLPGTLMAWMGRLRATLAP